MNPNGRLIRLRADDGTPLDGAVFEPPSPSDAAVVLFPGGGGEFYGSPLPEIAGALASAGTTVLVLNRRDHGSNFGFVPIERAARDQAAGIDFLVERGHDRIVAGGHSYASVTVPWYLAEAGDDRVSGVVVYSALGDMRVASTTLCGGVERYAALVETARAAVAEGRGDDHLVLRPMAKGGHPMVMSHRVFLDKRGPETTGDPFRLWPHVGDVPILAFRHRRDPFPGVRRVDDDRLRGTHPRFELVLVGEDGPPDPAAHRFEGAEATVADSTVRWLATG